MWPLYVNSYATPQCVMCPTFRLNPRVTEWFIIFSHTRTSFCVLRFAILGVRMWDTFCALATHVTLGSGYNERGDATPRFSRASSQIQTSKSRILAETFTDTVSVEVTGMPAWIHKNCILSCLLNFFFWLTCIMVIVSAVVVGTSYMITIFRSWLGRPLWTHKHSLSYFLPSVLLRLFLHII